MKLTRCKLATIALLGSSAALADVKINDYLSVSGYTVAAATTSDPDTGSGEETLFDSGSSNLDAAKFAILGKYESFSAKGSLFYIPNSKSDEGDAGILDAFGSVALGAVTITGGKYLSYLGYEAFDPVNMNQLTYGTTIAAIPAYHTGAKLDFAGEGYGIGVSVTDSLFPGDGFFQGDGEFSDDQGFEAIFTYTGVKNLTVFVGYGYDSTDGTPGEDEVINLWASYALSETLTIAGEYVNGDLSGLKFDSFLAFAQLTLGDGWSLVGRVTTFMPDSGGDGTYVTVAPTYAFNANFSVRAEVSYADSSAGGFTSIGDKGLFYGIQGVFKF